MILQSLALEVMFVLQILQVLNVLLRFLVCGKQSLKIAINFMFLRLFKKQVKPISISGDRQVLLHHKI